MLANNIFDIRTRIKINTNRFNINNLGYTNMNQSQKIASTVVEYKLPVILPKEFRFSIINIPKYTLVLVIKNEASLFSVNAYHDLLSNSNIQLLITSSAKYLNCLRIFYNNLYDENNKQKYMLFTDKMYKNIPIKSVDINKCYILHNDYNIKERYNCFYVNNSTDNIKLDMEEYEYQKFTTNSITWFLSKVFNNTLHKYNSSDILICTKNLRYLDHFQYIYLNEQIIKYFDIYFSWFNFSYSNYNLQLSEFILLIITFYFSQISEYNNLFIDSFINNTTNETIGLKKNNLLIGAQLRNKVNGDFFDFIKLINNKFGDISLDVDRYSSDNHLVLLKKTDKEYSFNNILIKKQRYESENIDIIKRSYPFNNIWIFNSINELKSINYKLDDFPDKNLKIETKNGEFYKIYNSVNENKYEYENIDKFIINFKEFNDDNIEDLINKINYFKEKIIVTILLDIGDNFNYFCYYYRALGFNIIFINLFDLKVDGIEKNNIIIVNKYEKLIGCKNTIFIRPNYYYNEIEHNGNNRIFNCIYFKDIGKSNNEKGIYSSNNYQLHYNNIYRVDIKITIGKRIRLFKFYNTILYNEYSGLFQY